MGDISLVSKGSQRCVLAGLEHATLPLRDMDGLEVGDHTR